MESRPLSARLVAVAAIAAVAGAAAGLVIEHATHPASRKASGFAPPPEAAIGADPLGQEIALGRRIFTDTGREVPRLVGNDLKCSNCHLDAGRRAGAAPLWAAYGLYPQFRKKNGHVNDFGERIRECFRYSMNGMEPAADDPAVVAVEAYAAFLATGAPLGRKLPGQGYAALAEPPQPPSFARGKTVFQAACAGCHGTDGGGQRSADEIIIPPLWGPRSFNWGAGMSDIPNAAAFIKANMPQDHPGSLGDQQAWDVAAYVDGKPRPQDPRFTGSTAETRRRFHDPARSAYGAVVDGVLLGGDGPPAAFHAPVAAQR